MDDCPSPEPAAADGAFFSSLSAETRFYFLRHGQSEGNARRFFQGPLDLPLDGIGRQQAAAAGAWLAARRPAAVLSSPLARAAETARMVCAACGLGEPELLPELAEIDTGAFTGLGFEEAARRYPEEYADFQSRSWDAVPGAETSSSCYRRALSAWGLLREGARAAGGDLVCVSHGGFIQWLVRSTFGCRGWMPLVPTSNCGLYELLAAPRGKGRGAYLQWKLMDFELAEGLPRIEAVF